MDFELPKLDVREPLPAALGFARFVLENLAFFDYARIDEIVHLVACLEKLVIHGIGTTVAHAIETEVLKVHLSQPNQEPAPEGQEIVQENTISPARLRLLTIASMILSMVWETRTHLRQMWGLAKPKTAAKPLTKDLNKPATKTAFYRPEILERIAAIMASLDDPIAMLAQCKSFAELVAVDHEHKVADEEEAELAAGYETPDGEDGGDANSQPGSAGGRGRKRKGSVGLGGTPAKKKRGSGGVKARPRGSGGGKGGRVRGRSKTGSASADEGEG